MRLKEDVIEYVKTLDIRHEGINISKILYEMLHQEKMDESQLKCILKVCATIYSNELHTQVQYIKSNTLPGKIIYFSVIV